MMVFFLDGISHAFFEWIFNFYISHTYTHNVKNLDVCLYFINNNNLATYLDVLIPRYFKHKSLQCIY